MDLAAEAALGHQDGLDGLLDDDVHRVEQRVYRRGLAKLPKFGIH